MISLFTNMPSLAAQAAGKSADRLHAQAMTRLSTGTRVNTAQDDAAGLAIGSRMTSTITASSRLVQDIANGISLAQVAESGLQNVAGMLQRMRQLAVQAATDTLTPSDREALNLEFQALNDEIDRTSRHTQAFDRTPLAPLKPAPALPPQTLGNTRPIQQVLSPNNQNFSSGLTSLGYIPQGFSQVTLQLDSFGADDDIQIFTTDGKHLLGTPILTNTDSVWSAKGINSVASATNQIMNAGNAFAAGASYDGSVLPPAGSYNTSALPSVQQYQGMTLRYSGDGHAGGQYLEKVTIDNVTENLVVMVIGNGSFSANGTWTEPTAAPAATGPFSQDTQITLSATLDIAPQSLTMTATPADTVTLGTADSQITTVAHANAALNDVDAALNTVNGYAVQYGAWISRFASASDNLQELATQTSSSRSRIIDADYAREATKLATQLILQEASHAMIAQANELPQSVLSLLQKP